MPHRWRISNRDPPNIRRTTNVPHAEIPCRSLPTSTATMADLAAHCVSLRIKIGRNANLITVVNIIDNFAVLKHQRNVEAVVLECCRNIIDRCLSVKSKPDLVRRTEYELKRIAR